jgi:fibronectin-binding autotransporter adhesin
VTTKIISGTYSAGYHLSTTFDAVTITAAGSVGGTGLVTSAFADVTNSGHLEATLGAGGVTLGSGGGALANASSGYIRGGVGAAGRYGGAGAYLTVYGAISDNLGDIVGGAGAAGQYGGGVAASFHAGGYIRNSGLVRGGAGGAGVVGSGKGYGGEGGIGVLEAASGTVVNYGGHTYGGLGGQGAQSATGGVAGNIGGTAIYLRADGYVDNYQGLVQGGAGGAGGNTGASGQAGRGGDGGEGIVLSGAGTVVNSGVIAGGAGAAGGAAGSGASGGGGGAGGDGVILGFPSASREISNFGTIHGGAGGSVGRGGGKPATSGAGGAGVSIYNGGTLLNYGAVVGGVGGAGGLYGGAGSGVSVDGSAVITNGSSADTHAFIGEATTAASRYGVGATVGSVVTVTNFGTISGGYAVLFSDIETSGRNPDTLNVEAGSAFVGTNFGGGGNLVLASGVGTVSASTSQIIVSGSMAPTTFGDFASLEIGAAASFTVAAGSDVPAEASSGVAAILIDAGSVSVAATLSVEGTIAVSGKLTGAKSSTLDIDGGAANFVTGASLSVPTVDVSGAAEVNVAANLAFARTWDQTGGTLSVDKGKTFTFKGSGSSFSGLLTGSGGVGNIAFAPAAPGTDAFNGVTIGELTVDVSGASLVVGAAGATIASTGTVRFEGASAGSFGGANTLANAGVIESAGAGGATIIDAVVNTGVLFADKCDLTLDGAVTGAGSAKITTATLDFASSFTGNVAFAGGSGELVLAQSQGYTGTITGFSKTGATSLDLGDIGFVSSTEATFSGTKTGGVLTVTDGTHTAHIALKGDYLTSTFIASSDGAGGVLITDPAAGGRAAQAPPHAFIAAMAGFGANLEAGLASPAMTGPRYIAATLLIPRVATA